MFLNFFFDFMLVWIMLLLWMTLVMHLNIITCVVHLYICICINLIISVNHFIIICIGSFRLINFLSSASTFIMFSNYFLIKFNVIITSIIMGVLIWIHIHSRGLLQNALTSGLATTRVRFHFISIITKSINRTEELRF